MFQRIFKGHRWRYGFLTLVVALGVNVATPQPSYSIPWWQIFQQGVQAIQLNSLSDGQEVQLGKQINQELIRTRKISLSQNKEINNYVNSIGQRLSRYSDRPGIPYTIQVVNDKSINAFATMGGYVYIHTGLIKAAANEAELASVIAHEIGHISGRHAIKQMRNAAVAQGILTAAGLDEKTWVQIGVKLAYEMPHSRKDELEADQVGLANLTKAGYAPSAMISFMQKLMQQGGSVPAVLSTHPATEYRIKKLQEQINPSTANQGEGLNQQAYQARIRSLI